ncbi:MAG: hypothetical protein LC658_00060 [Bacteroidales bacterium]|nr:hypothetical protein [Bacteroidales bacterium]
MKSIAIHQKDDWYLINLPGFGDIPQKQINIDVSLSEEEFMKNDYKALRGAVILEKYQEKRSRNIVEEPEERTKLDEIFGGRDILTLNDLLKHI